MTRNCRICNNIVYVMNEVDIGVGILYSNEVPICEDCYLSTDINIQNEIKQLLENKDLPF